MQEAKCRARRAGLPDEKEACGKRDESLGVAVAPIEATSADGGQKSAVQQESGQVGQRSTEAAAEEKKKNKPVDSGELVSEETEPEKTMNENDAADEELSAGCILLCIEGFLNGFPVKFLIDSGATDCFVSTAFVEEKELGLNKRKEKVKINLADGTTRVSKLYIKQACVSFEEHMEFLDFTVINLPNYEAIFGKKLVGQVESFNQLERKQYAMENGKKGDKSDRIVKGPHCRECF